MSLALTWSPEFLATQMPYVSGFGQFQSYLRFGPGLVWAAAARVGATGAFGRPLIAAKRFFAGGGNSVRGFKQDGVGPIDPLLGAPAGGAVVFVINQELRFPILGPVSGVVFYDAGSVYSTLRDVRVGDIRQGLGLGLRVRSPIGLIRADYGVNLRPRPGEQRGVFYLSIGQAF
jgi:outer membrane translocation and assembly module TamA